MINDDDAEIYHIICDISKVCREYFYGRKYLPRDFWKPDGDIDMIISLVDKLRDMIKK